MKSFDSKQELREEFERRTGPDAPVMEQAETVLNSMMLGSCLSIRNAIRALLMYTSDNDDFPCEEHKAITHRVTQGLKERMIAFELEIIGVLIDLAWEINNCTCDHCKQTQKEAEYVDKVDKAKYN